MSMEISALNRLFLCVSCGFSDCRSLMQEMTEEEGFSHILVQKFFLFMFL